MNNALLEIKPEDSTLFSEENIQNASSLLALLHGKSDSICRVFNKQIIVDKAQLSSLNSMMIDKLSLHNVNTITTSIDITFTDKKTVTYKSWAELELADFSTINAPTKCIYIQFDFFAQLNYKVPQRHTVSIRISSTPKPSDVFKVLLNGGFDESHDIDIQSSTMICKVDFINNTLAEELVNVAEKWNELCECAYSQKGKVAIFLYGRRRLLANILEFCTLASVCLLLAIAIKYAVTKNVFQITNSIIVYALLAAIPLKSLLTDLSRYFAKKIFDKFGDLLDTHIFNISKGDEKQNIRISEESKYGKELFWFCINMLGTIVLSIAFFLIG